MNTLANDKCGLKVPNLNYPSNKYTHLAAETTPVERAIMTDCQHRFAVLGESAHAPGALNSKLRKAPRAVEVLGHEATLIHVARHQRENVHRSLVAVIRKHRSNVRQPWSISCPLRVQIRYELKSYIPVSAIAEVFENHVS